MSEPRYVVISIKQCPHCAGPGGRFVLPIPDGGANHTCSMCGNEFVIESVGFSDTWTLKERKQSHE
jgi:hypothetical protein